ncbi:hypothetical protein DP117_04510 [Brasilonema sp. UFV-L1]|nr:hypothetical protein [Brasilonema sp. UFV-L1]
MVINSTHLELPGTDFRLKSVNTLYSLSETKMNHELKLKVHIRLEGDLPQDGMNYKVKYGVINLLSLILVIFTKT